MDGVGFGLWDLEGVGFGLGIRLGFEDWALRIAYVYGYIAYEYSYGCGYAVAPSPALTLAPTAALTPTPAPITGFDWTPAPIPGSYWTPAPDPNPDPGGIYARVLFGVHVSMEDTGKQAKCPFKAGVRVRTQANRSNAHLHGRHRQTGQMPICMEDTGKQVKCPFEAAAYPRIRHLRDLGLYCVGIALLACLAKWQCNDWD